MSKRFWIAAAAVFGFVFLYQWVLHGMVLTEAYAATSMSWRSDPEMMDKFGWMTGAYVLFALVFSYIFVQGHQGGGVMEGVRYGALIGLLLAYPSLITYVVQPVPLSLVLAWVVGELVATIGAGAILAAIYRPDGGPPAMVAGDLD